MKQLLLQLPARTNYSADAFLPTKGSFEACAALQTLEPSHIAHDLQGVVVVGERGCGKTHLLSMWAAGKGPECVAVDDVQDLDADEQEALFHAFNRLKEAGGALLVSSRVAVQDLPLLPDLKSRLLTLRQIPLLPPDDEELSGFLLKWASDLQLTLTPAVLAYLMARAERSVMALRAIVAALDVLSMEEKRGITVPMAKRVLEGSGAGETQA